jgi:hypothetical protein
MTRIRVVLATIPLVFGLAAFVPAQVTATHQGPGVPDPTEVSVSFVKSVQKQISDRIAAHLVAYDGSPIGGAEIEFRREIELLGPRLVLLGRATTDATGVAQVPIRATDARLRVEVRFAGDDRYAPSATTVDVVVPKASVRAAGQAAFEPPRPGIGLGQLAAVMPLAIAGATVGVWVALAALIFVTLRGIRRNRRNDLPDMEAQEGPS